MSKKAKKSRCKDCPDFISCKIILADCRYVKSLESEVNQLKTMKQLFNKNVVKSLKITTTKLTMAQIRLEVAEKIMEHCFSEMYGSEIFNDYCKLCGENEDCEWGDNFPHCFTEKSPECVKPSIYDKEKLEDFRDKLSKMMNEKPTKEEIEKREKLVREMGTLRPEDYFKRVNTND